MFKKTINKIKNFEFENPAIALIVFCFLMGLAIGILAALYTNVVLIVVVIITIIISLISWIMHRNNENFRDTL